MAKKNKIKTLILKGFTDSHNNKIKYKKDDIKYFTEERLQEIEKVVNYGPLIERLEGKENLKELKDLEK